MAGEPEEPSAEIAFKSKFIHQMLEWQLLVGKATEELFAGNADMFAERLLRLGYGANRKGVHKAADD